MNMRIIKISTKWIIILFLSTYGGMVSAHESDLLASGTDSLTNKEESIEDWHGLIEEIIENSEEGEEKDPELWQNLLSDLADNPVSLNTATKESLESIPFLTESQVEALSYYIYRYSPLVSLSELLLVDGIDEQTLRWLRPFVILGKPKENSLETPSLKKILSYGKQEILANTGRSLQNKLGYENVHKNVSADSSYLGDPYQVRLKYSFNFKNKVQWGLVLEKDAGERLWNKHNNGIDYASFHFLVKSQRRLKELILGDYNLKFGQGLVCSDYFSLGKNTSGLSVEQTGNIMSRHFSSSESGFFRGIVSTYILKPFTMEKSFGIEVTTFGSYRKLDGEIVDGYFSSISSTELHRTQKETAINDKIKLWTVGAHLTLLTEKGQFGITYLSYRFNAVFSPLWKLYNCNYFRGNHNENVSVDYRLRYNNMLFFGEMAFDGKMNTAVLAGLNFKPYSRLSLSLLGHSYAPEYNAYYANAFSEGTLVKNEYGFLSTGEWHFFRRWQLNFYCDVYAFPWLKYRINAPSDGFEYAIQTVFKPTSYSQINIRYKTMSKYKNINISEDKFPSVENVIKNQIRLQLSFLQGAWELKTLMDGNCVSIPSNQSKTSGLGLSQEINYSPVKRNYTVSLKYALFDTDNYENRIFSYEKSYPGSFSFSSYYGEGNRFSLLFNYKCSSKLNVWLKVSQSAYNDRSLIGTDLEQVKGNCLTDVSGMIRLKF